MSGKPQGKIKIKWSSDFAYAIGLIASDGCLSKDGRHLDFTSKDMEQINNFKHCLNLDVKTGIKYSGYTGKSAYRIQFGDILFYNFLFSIGLTPAKSKILGPLSIQKKYFFDFVRGYIDGDGCFYSYWDTRWKSSYMFYTIISSSSLAFLIWVRLEIKKMIGISGQLNEKKYARVYQLKYAKKESLILLKKLYAKRKAIYLSRKYLKIKRSLAIMGLQL